MIYKINSQRKPHKKMMKIPASDMERKGTWNEPIKGQVSNTK